MITLRISVCLRVVSLSASFTSMKIRSAALMSNNDIKHGSERATTAKEESQSQPQIMSPLIILTVHECICEALCQSGSSYFSRLFTLVCTIRGPSNFQLSFLSSQLRHQSPPYRSGIGFVAGKKINQELNESYAVL